MIYLQTNNNFSFHYYEDQCIAFGDTEFVFNQPYIDIIKLCDGSKTQSEIYSELTTNYQLNPDDLEIRNAFNDMVEQFIKNNIIYLQEKKQVEKTNFTGKLGKRYPRRLVIELTDKCNFFCPHCFKEACVDNSCFFETKQILNLLNNIAYLVESVELSGGESTLHPDINTIIEKATGCIKIVSLLTNGSNIQRVSQNNLKLLESLQVSLYGYDQESYYKFTNNKNSFDMVTNGLKYIVDNDVYLIVAIGINRFNFTELDKYIKFAVDHGANEIRFSLTQPLGRVTKKEFIQKWYFDDDELEYIKNVVDTWADRYDHTVCFRRLKNLYLKREKNVNTFKCNAGKFTLTVNERGLVRPCTMMPGDIFNMGSFEDVWKSFDNNEKYNFSNHFIKFEKQLSKEGFSFNDLKCTGFCEICCKGENNEKICVD